jgi:hypothetical protein
VATLNYSTNIPVARTVGEVQGLLAEHGADAIAVSYRDKVPVGITFTLAGPGGGRAFSLPVNVDGVHQVLAEQHRTGKIKSHVSKAAVTSPEQAARVAWRVLKDWVEAQLAIIEASMATLEQVMLPYLRVDGEITLYEAYAAHGRRALTAGQDPAEREAGR